MHRFMRLLGAAPAGCQRTSPCLPAPASDPVDLRTPLFSSLVPEPPSAGATGLTCRWPQQVCASCWRTLQPPSCNRQPSGWCFMPGQSLCERPGAWRGRGGRPPAQRPAPAGCGERARAHGPAVPADRLALAGPGALAAPVPRRAPRARSAAARGRRGSWVSLKNPPAHHSSLLTNSAS